MARSRRKSFLRDELKAASQTVGAQLVDDLEGTRIADLITEAFVSDPNTTWWWEHLTTAPENLFYGKRDECFGLRCLETLLGESSELLYLITRDAPGPPTAWHAPGPTLIEALGHCSFFEYLVTNETADWVVFDTHHSTLLVCGTPPGIKHLPGLRATADQP